MSENDPQAARVREILLRERQIEAAGWSPKVLEPMERRLGKMMRAALNGNDAVAEDLRPRNLDPRCVAQEIARLRSVGLTTWAGERSVKHPERVLSIKRLIVRVIAGGDLPERDPSWEKALLNAKEFRPP